MLSQSKLVLTTAVLLAGMGVVAWSTMIREEDPRLPDYFGRVVTSFPGADAETVERLVLDPLEEKLAEVDEVLRVKATANAELAVLQIDLRQDLGDTDRGWDRVRDALREARLEFPEGVGEPVLDDRVIDTDAAIYAVTGSADPLVLAAAAKRLEEELLAVPGVARVELLADPGEQIVVEYDASTARRLGVGLGELAGQLAGSSRTLPGGSVAIAGQTVRLKPVSEFESVAEIAASPVRLPSGDLVPLAAVAQVRRGPEEPTRFHARHDGEAMVGLGVVPRRRINLVDFGAALRRHVEAAAPRYAPLAIHEVAFQPDRVEARLSGLSRSLLFGALIVAGVLVLAMGLRVGLIVSAVVPVVVLSTLAIYDLSGGVLHQMSIAALVIALGMLVDNGIVVTEAIQWGVDRGQSAADAAVAAVRELAVPLAAATATTLAAFVPMLLATGVTADFTRALPIVIMLTLTVSYFYAVLVTPALGRLFLRPRPGAAEGTLLLRLARRLSGLAVRRTVPVLVATLVVLALSVAGAGWVRQGFFPGADRNQFLVELRLPEGTHLAQTDAVARRLERALAERAASASVTAFVGRSAPRFYYNVEQVPWSPHFGQLIVTTGTVAEVDGLVAWTRDYARRELPAAQVIVRKLEQGPPLAAPVELRLYGDDLRDLARGVDLLVRELREIPGAVDVRHDLSTGAPVINFRVDDAAAARRGYGRQDVARALYGETRGLLVGQFRQAPDPVPILLRAPRGENLAPDELLSIEVAGPGREAVPLAALARRDVEWRPAAIEHRDRRRVASVLAQLAEGASYSDVTAALEPRLAGLGLPAGVEVAIGGAAEESGQANTAILRAVPLGALLLIGVLMAEFRSFRRVGIVLVTVPLAAAGVVPGLLVSGQPFGFMSMLGIVALVGVVVNNAIVLLEVIEEARRDGATVAEAVGRAAERRLRPILLTTATTVAGLVPLAVSDSTLWPPMAWAIISGLTASTLLTLLVVPALYVLLFADRAAGGGWREHGSAAGAATALAALALVVSGPAAAAEEGATVRLTLAEAIARGGERPLVRAAEHRAAAAEAGARAERRSGRLPALVATGGLTQRDRTLDLATPIGSFPFAPDREESASVTLVQPLVDAGMQVYAARAGRAESRSAELAARRGAVTAAASAAEAFLDVLALDAGLEATAAFVASLERGLEDAEARRDAGVELAADVLKIELALAQARQERLALEQQRLVATQALGLAVGSALPVEPVWDGPPPLAPLPDFAAALERATSGRPDLRALEQRAEALEQRRKAIRAEALPRLEAAASWIWSPGSPYAQDQWVEGGLRLRWAPFEAATRGARAEAAGEEREAAEAEYQEAVRGLGVELRAALAQAETARSELDVRRLGVEQAAETARVERLRHREGRITTNDLLAAEAALRAERTRLELAGLELVRARVRLELAVGVPDAGVGAPGAGFLTGHGP